MCPSCAIMSLFVLSAGLFDTILGGGVIPTREEQANLLTNVEEVFEQVKLLVNVEANSTDESVARDINRMVERAKDQLTLIEELTLTKMSCLGNSVCMLDAKPIVPTLVGEARANLRDCMRKGSEDIKINSLQLTNVTVAATRRGQDLLDALRNCSSKAGLLVVSCYKDIIAKDVVPVKHILLQAINSHRDAHFRTIEIRTSAGDCVDRILQLYQDRIAKVLKNALACT